MYRTKYFIGALILTIVNCLFCSLAFAQDQQSQSTEGTISIDATLVNVPVIVSDRSGRYVAGLKAEDFTLYEDNVNQPIAFFDTSEEPLNVAILLDTSKSTASVLNEIKDAAIDFLRELRSKDQALVMSFDYEPHLLSAFTNNQYRLRDAILSADIGSRPGTTLNDAVGDVLERHFKNLKGRKALILLTDGKDVRSQLNSEELIDMATESNVVIYPVYFRTDNTNFGGYRNNRNGGYGNDRNDGPIFFPRGRRNRRFELPGNFPDYGRGDDRRGRQGRRQGRIEEKNQQAEEFLVALSDNTAGRFFNSEETNFAQSFRQIAEELRHQYQLGFYPDSQRVNGDLHSLKVKLNRSDLVVRARRNYRVENQNSQSDQNDQYSDQRNNQNSNQDSDRNDPNDRLDPRNQDRNDRDNRNNRDYQNDRDYRNNQNDRDDQDDQNDRMEPYDDDDQQNNK